MPGRRGGAAERPALSVNLGAEGRVRDTTPRAPTQDGRTHERSYGRAMQGECTSWLSLFLHGRRPRRFSLLPITSAEGLPDWKINEDSVNTERFLEFTEGCIIVRARSSAASYAETPAHTCACPVQLPRMSAYAGEHSVMVSSTTAGSTTTSSSRR